MSKRLIVFLVLLLITVQSDAAQPRLKPGARLMLTASRSQGWAAPEVTDWNNDGLNDLVVGHLSGALYVYLNRGYGPKGLVFEKHSINRRDSFGTPGNHTWAWRFNKATCVCPGPGRISPRVLDWDSDGKKDLLIGDGRGAQIRIWQNIGTDAKPVFSTHALTYLPPDAGVRPYHETVQPCLADWNGDGRIDLFMGRNRGLYVYFNKGTNADPDFDFERSRLGTKISDVFPAERLSPVVVDWDGDDKLDIVVGSQRGEVWFACNVGSSNKPKLAAYSAIQADDKPVRIKAEARIAVADMDGDGLSDLLVGSDQGLVRFYQSYNPSPVARSRVIRVEHGGRVSFQLIGTDDADRELSYSILTKPMYGSLSGTAPVLVYTAKQGFTGIDEIEFRVTNGDSQSKPARVRFEVQPPVVAPTITTEPIDDLVAIGQPAELRVVAKGTPPFKYQWSKDGQPISRATGASFKIRQAKEDDGGNYSVSVTNAAGMVSSRAAQLQVKPVPGRDAQLPIIDIKLDSPVIEPATPGVLTITRTGNTSKAVTVKIATRRGHDPVIADIHFQPVPTSITLKPGQKTAQLSVTPIDDTLVNGTRTLRFLIVPNPAYRLKTKTGSAMMRFLDDDCPDVGIAVVKDAKQSIQFTAVPPPRLDTEVSYTVAGTAIPGEEYDPLFGTITIPAGHSSATIDVKSYRFKPSKTPKTVTVKLVRRPFTFFDFFHYLTPGRSQNATIQITPSETTAPPITDVESEQRYYLRKEVTRLGWIIFSGQSGGETSDLDLFVMRPDGSHLRNLTKTPDTDEYNAQVSPNGKRLLYWRSAKTNRTRPASRLPQDVGTVAMRSWPSGGTLMVADLNGSDPKPLSKAGACTWASWGPEGKRIACLEEIVSTDAPTKPNAKKKAKYKIVLRDAESFQVIKELKAAGIHSQAVWSPDGKFICGPANIRPGKARLAKGMEYPLGIGQMVSLDVETGKRTSMARFPDWYPVWAIDTNGDWFQGGSPQILHSANNYGICPAYFAMLYRSGRDGKASQLVFAEYKKHVWGGCTSPDDKYAIFVIGGDRWPLQGKMAIVRLADAPLARGRSQLFHEVLADHFPGIKHEPILDLMNAPEGFEPHWTMADFETN